MIDLKARGSAIRLATNCTDTFGPGCDGTQGSWISNQTRYHLHWYVWGRAVIELKARVSVQMVASLIADPLALSSITARPLLPSCSPGKENMLQYYIY